VLRLEHPDAKLLAQPLACFLRPFLLKMLLILGFKWVPKVVSPLLVSGLVVPVAVFVNIHHRKLLVKTSAVAAGLTLSPER
jgi:hypothetical protein